VEEKTENADENRRNQISDVNLERKRATMRLSFFLLTL
jgi:hypothetical protein